METVLKNSVSNNYYGEAGQSGSGSPSAEVLRELSDSRYTVFDVLPSFFSHSDPKVILGKSFHSWTCTGFPDGLAAAFEVYVRRAYRAYTVLSVDYEEGDTLDDGEAPNIVTWRFNLGQSHSPPSTPRFGSGYVY